MQSPSRQIVGPAMALAGALWGTPIAVQAQAQHVAEVGSWAPYIDFSTADQGVLTRQVRDAFKAGGISLQLRESSWKAAEEHIDRNSAVSFGWIRTTERETRWFYSRPICTMRTVLVTRADQPIAWTRMEQLRGIRLGWSRGYSYGNALDQLRPSLDVTEMADDTIALKRLLLGSVDAVPMDPLVARALIRQTFNPADTRRFLIDLAPQHTIDKADLHVVCAQASSNCKATLERFNRGLRQLRGDGPVPACGDPERPR